MRTWLAAVLLFLCTVLGAQTPPLVLENVSVREAIREIHQWSDCTFVWESDDMDTDRTVSIHADSLDEALQQVFAGQDISWTVKDKTIIVSRLAGPLSGEAEFISGTVRVSFGLVL